MNVNEFTLTCKLNFELLLSVNLQNTDQRKCEIQCVCQSYVQRAEYKENNSRSRTELCGTHCNYLHSINEQTSDVLLNKIYT